jgi:hypothetical protein
VNDSGCGAATRYISYDDAHSIIAKGMFSRTEGYGGITKPGRRLGQSKSSGDSETRPANIAVLYCIAY